MPNKDNVQESILVFGELEKSLLDEVISLNIKKGVGGLSSLFDVNNLISDDDLTENTHKIFQLLEGVASMRLIPENINEPFQALVQMADGRRSALPRDFSINDLKVLATIFETVLYMPLLARLGDVLWLCNKPKNPKHAQKAIVGYISQGIDHQTWHYEGRNEFHRAYQLALNMKSSEHISTIETLLKKAFLSKDDIAISVAQLIDDLSILKDSHVEIATHLEKLGEKLLSDGKPESAIQFFQLASKKYNQGLDTSKYIVMLVRVAECYALDSETDSGLGSEAIICQNMLVKQAIKAYRKIPKKYREEYCVNQKISELKYKLSATGKGVLNEMDIISADIENVDKILKESIDFVSKKASPLDALISFSNVLQIPDYKGMEQEENDRLKNDPTRCVAAPDIFYSSDGRVVGETPVTSYEWSDDDALCKEAIKHSMIKFFNMRINGAVQIVIIPALQAVIKEYDIEDKFILGICNISPIVPIENVKLIARAISLGFKLDFSTAIHLVAPQMEKIIRMLIKNQGGHTTNIYNDGKENENENGLSSFLAMKEASSIFGEDVLFELKAVFSDPTGANLRNKVAHGLVTDDVAYSAYPVYAWWVLVRMVVHSLITPIQEDGSNSE